jgi:cell wall-associated NlpC family hydrolase
MKNAFVFKLARIPVIRSRYAMIARPDTVVRTAPGSNAHRIAKVDAGRQVRVLDRDDHWYKVRFEHGTEGWVRGDLLVAQQPTIVAVHHETRRHHEQPQMTLAAYHPAKHRAGRTSRGGAVYHNLPSLHGDMLSFAQSMKGTPYSYGSASRHATDCSGFVKQVMQHGGISMPRTAAEQSQKGTHVSGGELKAGDLVFFHTSRGSRISHVGIYMGNGKFIHASSGGGKVQVNSLDDKYYKKHFATARRVAKVHGGAARDEKIARAHDEDERAMRAAERQMKGK